MGKSNSLANRSDPETCLEGEARGEREEGFEEPARVAARAFWALSGKESHLLVDPETGTLYERHVHDMGGATSPGCGPSAEGRAPVLLPTGGFDGSTKVPGDALFEADEVRTGIELSDDLFRPPDLHSADRRGGFSEFHDARLSLR
jgi:hypothetical protein